MATIPTKPTVMITSFLLDYLCNNVCDVGCQWFLTRPLVLICPGGGYEFTFDRKAEAIAVQYIARGFHACVLRYSVVPAKFPQSLYELAWSVAYLRKHAAEYGIKPDKIIVAGFPPAVIWQQASVYSGIRTGLQKKQNFPLNR